MAAGLMALVTGVVAIAKEHERTVFVYLSTLLGALLVIFLLGEIFFPH
jgi:hypothetical protein